ncbi:hypothetical protein M404DRAFT_1008778 [Pisolithus tinctorius Marx 270]|uniref:Uncharacterized protein n=1 Tax=Pisolithus tinctorius Marx 270 TaxID=870435 RepID=A0A0C3MXT6_PISTI|nr:hypothetical protein M404DRAFT_1008778 [Pisolithus tinctorius Marx 270]
MCLWSHSGLRAVTEGVHRATVRRRCLQRASAAGAGMTRVKEFFRGPSRCHAERSQGAINGQ